MRNHLCAIFNISLIPFRKLKGLLTDPDTWKAILLLASLCLFAGILPLGLPCFGLIAYFLGRRDKQGEMWLFISDTKYYFLSTPIGYIISYALMYHLAYRDSKSVFGAMLTCNLLAFLFSFIPVFIYMVVPEIYTGVKEAYNRAYDRCANKEK